MPKRRDEPRPGRAGEHTARVQPPRWTKAKEQRFIDYLAETANVRSSLAEIGMSVPGLYKFRRRSPEFRAAWDAALAQGYARLEAELLDRALNGKRVTVERDGVTVETVEVSDALGFKLLALHRRAVAEYRAAVAAVTPREPVEAVRNRIVKQIMTVVAALPDRDTGNILELRELPKPSEPEVSGA